MWMGLHWEWPRKGNIPADREAPHRRHGRRAVRFELTVGQVSNLSNTTRLSSSVMVLKYLAGWNRNNLGKMPGRQRQISGRMPVPRCD
jgi:hypothetical protein